QGSVRNLHGDVVDVVAAGIGRALVVGCGREGERAGRAVDGELGGIGAADDRIGQCRSGIEIGGRDRGDGGRVLGDVDRGGGTGTVRGDDRGVVVDVGDRDGDRLGVGQRAVGNLDGDVVDVVASDIGWDLIVGSG